MRPVFSQHEFNAIAPTDLNNYTAAHGLHHAAAHRTLTDERTCMDQADVASDGDWIAV